MVDGSDESLQYPIGRIWPKLAVRNTVADFFYKKVDVATLNTFDFETKCLTFFLLEGASSVPACSSFAICSAHPTNKFGGLPQLIGYIFSGDTHLNRDKIESDLSVI